MKLNINTEQRNDNYNWINEHNQGLRVNNQLGFIYKVLRKTNCESTLLRQEPKNAIISAHVSLKTYVFTHMLPKNARIRT